MGYHIPIRFRHTAGDLGPFQFKPEDKIYAIKQMLFENWPKDGSFAKEKPKAASDIRLILSGKFVEDAKSLNDYKKDIGEVTADTLITMHLIVRPSEVVKAAPTPEKVEPKGCGCVIS